MVKVMNKIGCNILAIHPMRSYEEIEDQVEPLLLNLEEKEKMKNNIDKAKKLADKYELEFNTSMMEESGIIPNSKKDNLDTKHPFLSSLCYEPFYNIFIDPSGNTAPCCGPGIGNKNLNLSKISLKQVWESQLFESKRKSVLNKELTLDCKNCGLLDMTSELRMEILKIIEEKKRRK